MMIKWTSFGRNKKDKYIKRILLIGSDIRTDDSYIGKFIYLANSRKNRYLIDWYDPYRGLFICFREDKLIEGTAPRVTGLLSAILMVGGFLFKNKNRYDFIHFQGVSPIYWFFLPFIGDYILTFWGSDLYQINGIKAAMCRALVGRALAVSLAREKMIKRCVELFGDKRKLFITRFASIMDFAIIDRVKKSDIDEFNDKHLVDATDIVITIGHSSSSNDNHSYIIEEVAKLPNYIACKFFLFLPMGYGDSGYRDKIIEKCSDVLGQRGIRYYIEKKVMSLQEIAVLRKRTNITINLLNTDVLSASMQENLYAGNVVINGAWLDYSELRKLGAYYEVLDRLEDGLLRDKLLYVLENIDYLREKSKVNKNIILKINNWNDVVRGFINMYDCLNPVSVL
ncbi:MAG: hypothetical protein N2315_00790 [Thermanaerothrix sp.]|nr:hypothetical protein [Thermanaerothrix sp.]